jgi:hypothetical protein
MKEQSQFISYKYNTERNKIKANIAKKKARLKGTIIGAALLMSGMHITNRLPINSPELINYSSSIEMLENISDEREDNLYFDNINSENIPKSKKSNPDNVVNSNKSSTSNALMVELARNTDFINIGTLKVDKKYLQATHNSIDMLSLGEIIENCNLYGLHKSYTGFNKGKMDFDDALAKMWDKKKIKMQGRFGDIADKFTTDYSSVKTPKSDLNTQRAKIAQRINLIVDAWDYDAFYLKHNNPSSKIGSLEKQRFFQNYIPHINDNLFVAFGLTELFPKEINPVVNIKTLDEMYQIAGEEFVNKIPALHDKYLSFSLFQLTSLIIQPDGAPSLNKYLPENLRIPQSMKHYDTSDELIRGAILVNLYNSEILVNHLHKENLLEVFNNNFEKMSKKKQDAFVAGYSSAAHHASSSAARAVCAYVKKFNPKKDDFEDIITDLPLNNKLKDYYNQRMKNYIVLNELEKL